MLVTVSRVTIYGTVGVGYGRIAESGEPIRFGGDWRPMGNLAEAVILGEQPEVEIEPWQVLGPAKVIYWAARKTSRGHVIRAGGYWAKERADLTAAFFRRMFRHPAWVEEDFA